MGGIGKAAVAEFVHGKLGEPAVVEGNWRPSFLVMIEFPSLERATAWYSSDDYKDLKAMRLSAVDSEGVLMTGIEEAAA